jgi:hypothetical protein
LNNLLIYLPCSVLLVAIYIYVIARLNLGIHFFLSQAARNRSAYAIYNESAASSPLRSIGSDIFAGTRSLYTNNILAQIVTSSTLL